MSMPIDPRCFGADTYGLRHIMFTYVAPFLTMIGSVGDVLMLLTIHYGRLKESPYVYLECIAGADLMLMLWHASTWVFHCRACNFSVTTMYYLKHINWYCYIGVAFFMETWILFMSLFLTMERFVYVRWPMQTRSLCTRGRAKKICFVMLLVTFVLKVPFLPRMQVSIKDNVYPKPGVSFRVSDFSCKPNFNEESSNNNFTCYNWKFPVKLQSLEADPRCSNGSIRLEDKLQKIPRTGQSLYSLDCLHQFCELPQLPGNLSFMSVSDYEGTNMLYTTSMNAKLIALTNGSTIYDHHHLLPRENLTGRAVYVDETCTYVLASSESKNISTVVSGIFLDDYADTVPCVRWRERRDWMKVYFGSYWRAWLWRRETFTVLLTGFNIFIVIVVRRANRNTAEGVLSNSGKNSTFERRAEENRLTWSLVLLSSVKILRDVLYNTCQGWLAPYIYTEVSPPGVPLRINWAMAYTLDVVEWSSSFYLFAFCNRTFKEVFLQRVVRDKLQLHNVFKKKSPNVSNSNTSTTSQRADKLDPN